MALTSSSPAPKRARRLLALAVAATALGAGCAFVSAPYPTPPPLEPTPSPSNLDDACPKPELALSEGQPRGLLLTLSWDASPPSCAVATRAVLLRQDRTGDAEWSEVQVHYTFDLGQAPEAQPTRFLDRGLLNDTSYRYALALADADGAVLSQSDTHGLRWQPPPPPPTELAIDAVGQYVHLEWSGAPELGALVFRRQIGKQGIARVSGVLPPGADAFVDASAQPGAVYSYLVSSVRFIEGTPTIGAPTAEMYVEAAGP